MTYDLLSILLPYKPISSALLKPEQKICVEFANSLRALTLEGKLPYVWYHIPNEFLPSTTKNFTFELKQKHMGKIAGVPDYCFIGKGDSFFIEFKASRGKLTLSQKTFEGWCKREGVDYFLCRSAEEGIGVVRSRKISYKQR